MNLTTLPGKLVAKGIILTQLALLSGGVAYAQQAADPYQTSLYWKLNETPMQQRLRAIKPLPVSVVYYQQRDHKLPEIKSEFEKIKSMGFQGLKQVMLRGTDITTEFQETVFKEALKTGLSPWYYGMGGWEPITDKLVADLGIKLKLNEDNIAAIQKHPAMQKYQTEMLMKRVDNMKNITPLPKSIQMGEPGRGNPFMVERLIPMFADWLQKQYGTVAELNKAWAAGYTTDKTYTSFQQAAEELMGTGIDEFGKGKGKLGWNTRNYRDAMRFQADLMVDDYKRAMEHYTKFEPNEPKRTGAHQLFENQALNGWDFEGQAKAAAIGGSFYSSVHLAHHFFLTDGEITKPVYVQARIINDSYKGGWAATWESTGGPTQWSGTHSFSVDGKLIKRLMYSYLAAGLKGIGFWTWNSRDVGWELGEYALTNLQGEPTDRAKVAAEVAKAVDKERFDLWAALDEPTVGILYSWENEAQLARLSLGSYPLATRAYNVDRDPQFAQYYSQARVGISRALMNRNIPFEYVSETDLAAGLIKRYKVIYLPHMYALSGKTLEILKNYVAEGGKLVADMPLLMSDDFGVLNKWKKGSITEQVFGLQIHDYQHTFNNPIDFYGVKGISTQYADLSATTAQLEKNGSGNVLAARNNFGKGKAVLFNFEASRACFKEGNSAIEKALADEIEALAPSEFKAEGKAMVFRRSSPKADYYFVVNEGDAGSISIKSTNAKYKSAYECLTNSKFEVVNGNSITVNFSEKESVWIKCLK